MAVNKKLIQSCFEQIVEVFPEHAAVEDDHGATTYRELNGMANHIAHTLLSHHIRKDCIVGLFFESSCLYVASVLGVLKSAALFMPLATDLPVKRFEYMLNKTNPRIIITHETLKKKLDQQLKNLAEPIMVISLPDPHLEQSLYHENPPLRSAPDDGMYIMFTSGTSGDPKAILGCHKGLSHFIHWEIKALELCETVRVSQIAPITFDKSFADIFVPLLTGGTVYIPEKNTLAIINKLIQWLKAKKITLLHCVPSFFRLLAKEIQFVKDKGEVLKHLRHILLAGEPLYGRDVSQWMETFKGQTQLINLYGPTETTMVKTHHWIRNIPDNPGKMISIGQPISNTAVLVLKNDRLCRIGEIGEIYIKTPFATLGYYGDDELTAGSFVQNPLNDKKDIIYKTGDLGKYLPDRRIDFIGRLDRQVKIAGIRIELSEIENVCLRYEKIEQVFVRLHQSPKTGEHLICYLVEKEKTTDSALKRHLAAYLPHAMMPSFFIRMEAFPLNLNGKIDAKALPEPDELLFAKANYEAPADEMESRLTAIWQEVMGLERIGVKDLYFEIGGTSINAIKIISRIYRDFSVEVSIHDFFSNPDIKKLSRLIQSQQKKEIKPIEPARVEDYYELSHSQKRLWVVSQLQRASVAYNICGAYVLEGSLDFKALEGAFGQIIQRHESLRTGFILLDGEPRQKVMNDVAFNIEKIDLSHQENAFERAQKTILKEAAIPFDLTSPPLLRIKVFVLARDRFLLFISIHHIVSDAWSFDVLAREMMDLYQQIHQGERLRLPAINLQYKDFSTWQNGLLKSPACKPHQTYWHDKLAGDLPLLHLPYDFPRPQLQTFIGQTKHFTFKNTIYKGFVQLSQKNNVSLFMSLVALVKVLLHRYTLQEDIILGAPAAGRIHPDLEGQIGFYVNTLALRDKIYGNDSFLEIVQRIKQTTVEAHDHQLYPFDILVTELGLKRDVSRSVLFDVGISLENQSNLTMKMADVVIHEYKIDWGTSKVDMTFMFKEDDANLSCALIYNTGLFKESTLERMISHIEELMISILAHADLPIKGLNMLNQSERQKVLVEFNRSNDKVHLETTIIDQFERQVAKTPHRTALVFEDGFITYQELNDRANGVAHALKEKWAVGIEDLVAIMINRSGLAVLGILGIMKSGGLVVPMDPESPQERIRYMIQDSGCQLILAGPESMRSCVRIPNIQAINLLDLLASHPKNPDVKTSSQNAAYMIYTSGSTGFPKGVIVKHLGFVNMAQTSVKEIGFSSSDRVLQFASLSFDGAFFEVFSTFFCGAALICVKKEIINNFTRFSEFVIKDHVTIGAFPPSYLHSLKQNPLEFMRIIISAGEQAVKEDAWYYGRSKAFINGYGPTEFSVGATLYRVDLNHKISETIPIGKPLANTRIYIMDEMLKPVPIGIPGEICLGGPGLARGYMNNIPLTIEKFVKDPFREGQKIYKTGDIGKWLDDGNIEFMGRLDDQVKVRGHRIELGEIERTLKRHPDISEAIVRIHWSGKKDKLLSAYFVKKRPGKSHRAMDTSDRSLREFLGQRIPHYMVPAHFIEMDAFPLTERGKIDKNALTAPESKPVQQVASRSTPGNEMETTLCQIWKEVLLTETIGMDDNFFSLGGDSLKAIQMVSRLTREKLKLEVTDIFQFPSISELAKRITPLNRMPNQGPTRGDIPLVPVQTWFLKERQGPLHHYNQSVMLYSPRGFDQDIVKKVFTELQNHHDALRIKYKITKKMIRQENCDVNCPLDLGVVDLRGVDNVLSQMEIHSSRAQRHIHIERGPLLKLLLFKLEDGDRLLIVIHHLVVDLVSWWILIDDFKMAYQQYDSSGLIGLPPKTASFKAWAEELKRFSNSPLLLEEIDFWNGVAKEQHQSLLKGDLVKENLMGDRVVETCYLDEKTTEDLLLRTNQAYQTKITDLLLTTLTRTVCHLFGETKAFVSIVNHGRENFADLDVSRTIGWFAFSYPVVLSLSPSSPLGEQINHIKETMEKTPNKGIGYGILKYMTPKKAKAHLKMIDTPPIAFNYLGPLG